MNTNQTQMVIMEMADQLTHYAQELREIACKMSRSEDLTYAADAMTAIRNMNSQLRTDLLITRPLREAGIK